MSRRRGGTKRRGPRPGGEAGSRGAPSREPPPAPESRIGQVVYGRHAVHEAAAYDPAGVECLWVEAGRSDPKLDRLLAKLERSEVVVHRPHRRELDRLAGGGNHQGVVMRYRGTPARGEAELAELLTVTAEPLLLVLDRVQDPHNLGACLRSAAAAGVDGVIAPRDHAAALSPVVHKVAAGGVQRVPFFQVTNLARSLAALQKAGVVTVGAVGDAEKSLYEIDLSGPLALLLGGEGGGLRRLTRERCDFLAAIPMPGPMESLNVSVAAGVFLFEAVRQRTAY